MTLSMSTLKSPTHVFTTSTLQQKQCSFSRDDFLSVMHNLIRNPNITSSHLFRADIFWDSDGDTTYDASAIAHVEKPLSAFTKHMKAEYRPWKIQIEGFELQRTIVRQLVPRNPQLDKPLVQTCHFFTRSAPHEHLSDDPDDEGHSETGNDEADTLIVYLPHGISEDDIPWYHPPLRAIGFLYTLSTPHGDLDSALADERQETTTVTFSIHTASFPNPPENTDRTIRSLANLLNTISRHATARPTYIKRTHHDRIISQKAFQDTYTRLKQKYAKSLVADWREQTAASKGVFEDLGIAAFLMELWKGMYSLGEGSEERPAFPGFVDLACGNGCLVYILKSEGYAGWGFDARRRKTWDAFPADICDSLEEMVLIPSSFSDQNSTPAVAEPSPEGEFVKSPKIHNGIFSTPQNGQDTKAPFLISNHADELTPWTPLLAYLNDSSFITIPCCSHSLDGAKYRYPHRYLGFDEASQHTEPNGGTGGSTAMPKLYRSSASAYATICGYIASLSRELGFETEKEELRIPSTRNVCIVGRRTHKEEPATMLEERLALLRRMIERDAQTPVAGVMEAFSKKAFGIWSSKGRNH